MEPFAGTIGSIMIYFITAYSAKLVALDTQVYDMPIWKVALAVHIVCWILQFIGHGVFEGMLQDGNTRPGKCYINVFLFFQEEHLL